MPAHFRITAILLLLLAVAAGASQVVAQGVAHEFRGSTRGRQGALDHIWKLQADGRITGVSTERRGGGLGGYSIDLSDSGTWQLRQNQLCIEWSGSFRPFSGCYGIERRQGNHVALNGPSVFNGQLDPLPPLR